MKHTFLIHDVFDLGRALGQIRRGRGKTIVTLAREAGMHENQISNLERSKNAPTAPTLLRLLRALDVDLVLIQRERVIDPALALGLEVEEEEANHA
jgi:transcriptional regulator with XRE-family HTH domain